MIGAGIERCAGIDGGKKFIAVCGMTGPADGEPRSEIRTFGSTVAELKQADMDKQRRMHGRNQGEHRLVWEAGVPCAGR